MRSIHISAVKRGILILSVLCVSLLYATQARGQAVSSGILLGTVTDATGAVVPGAQVTVTNVATGLERQKETSGTGTFRFPFLPLGSYTFRIEKAGFDTLVSDEVEVHVGAETRSDYALSLGAVATTIEVESAAAVINTTNSERGYVVEGKSVTDLPLNFREFTSLGVLAPGAMLDHKARIFGNKSNITVNGLRSQMANLQIDGIDSNETHWGGMALNFYSVDNIAEFLVTTSNYAAEVRGSSINIRAVTKSGSNDVHGSAYEFLRNDVLDARNFFDKNDNDPITGDEIPGSAVKPLRLNQFGATLGGPIVKNKLFWFSGFEALRESRTTTSSATVPTADERAGTVLAINPVSGLADTLFVPVAASTASVIGRYPLPNDPGGASGARTFSGPLSSGFDYDQATLKFDWQKSDKDTFSLGLTWFDSLNNCTDSLIQGPDFGGCTILRDRHHRLSNVHVFGPNLVNEVRIGYHRAVGDNGNVNRQISPTLFRDGTFTTLNGGGTSFGTVTNVIQFSDSVSYLRGRHSLKAGVEFRNLRDTTDLALRFPGQFLFSQSAPIVADVPTLSGVTIPAGSVVFNSMVNFLQGAPDEVQIRGTTAGFPGPAGYYNVRQSAFEWYIQDDFKITPKLTLNLGLRYEYHTVYRFRNRGNYRGVFSGPDTGDLIFNPDPFYDRDLNNFAPRVGLAYAASSKMVIRAGFAIFTVAPMRQSTEGAMGFFPAQSEVSAFITDPAARVARYSNPLIGLTVDAPALFDVSGIQITPDGPGSETNRVMDGLRFVQDTISPENPVGFLMNTQTNGGTMAKNFRDAYIMNWNLTVEREIGQGIGLSAAYVGNSGIALHSMSIPFCGSNAFNPICAPFQKLWFDKGTNVPWISDNSAHSTYHALQLQAKKAFNRGYQFQANFAYGKNISASDWNIADLGRGEASGGGTDPFNRKRDKGRGIADRRFQFTLNGMYELPYFGGPKVLANGWQFQTIWSLRTGLPYFLYIPGTVVSGYGFTRIDLPDILTDAASFPRGSDKTDYFADSVRAGIGTCGTAGAINAFVCSPGDDPSTPGIFEGRDGNIGRGVFDDAAFKDIAFSVIKNTNITESVSIQFRAEFFNLFNFVNLDRPGGNILAANFGRYSSTVSAASPPVTERQIQFGLRIIF